MTRHAFDITHNIINITPEPDIELEGNMTNGVIIRDFRKGR